MAGFGVFAGLAISSSGAFQNSDTAITVVTVTSKAMPSRKNAYGYEKTSILFLLRGDGLEKRLAGDHLHEPVGLLLGRRHNRNSGSGSAVRRCAPAARLCSSFSFQTGRDKPPSLRIRQKCTMVSRITSAGSTATCST